MKNKEFDTVKLMRDIRTKLSKKYLNDPEAEEKDLEKIKKKYNIQERNSSHRSQIR